MVVMKGGTDQFSNILHRFVLANIDVGAYLLFWLAKGVFLFTERVALKRQGILPVASFERNGATIVVCHAHHLTRRQQQFPSN